MPELNIEKFNPLKAEVIELVENIKKTVANANGNTGYELMKENKKILQKKRTESVAFLKSEREGFIAGQKFVINLEKEILQIIADVENPLTEKINEIEEAEKREKRKEILPERIEKLKEIDLVISDDEILDMDDKQFAAFFIEKKEIYLNEKQAKIDAENKRIQDEKEQNEREQKRLADLEQARLDGIAQAQKDAENLKNKEIADKAKKEKEEKEAKEKLEKRKKYIKFREDCGYTEENKNDFFEQNVGDKIILFKKVGEFKI